MQPRVNISERCDVESQLETIGSGKNRNSVIESLITGSISSTVTTIVYQPLELLKTRLQIRDVFVGEKTSPTPVLGRLTQSAIYVAKNQGLSYLWRGTGASLLRSGPGVGLYYALLNVMQSNFSGQTNRPDTATQAFYFGLTARSMVSFILLPITVVKVRYESGRFSYPSLSNALKNAYTNSNGWVGVAPTVLRDSLFSGIYYMCYTKLKVDFTNHQAMTDKNLVVNQCHWRNFSNGIVSGMIASIVTNPIDVLKTTIQVSAGNSDKTVTMRQVTKKLLIEPRGYLRFFDGLVPRSIRRTLIAASTWTFYELMIEIISARA